MALKVWDNLFKFMFARWLIRLNETLNSGYRFLVRILRKATPRIIRFRWLRGMINSLLPCPEMVQRYIDPDLGIEEFFSILNKRGIRYTLLRWFENLPRFGKGDDIDMLVQDDDLPKIKDLFVTLPTGISCDIYSVSPIDGASYRKDVPLYPSHLAQEMLDTSVLHKGTYRVPDPKRYFLSLAYHAVYHKAEASGLPGSKSDPVPKVVDREHSYAEKVATLGRACGFNVNPDLRSLHELLTECSWNPRTDVLRVIAKGSRWLTALSENSDGHSASKKIIRYPFDVYGVRVVVESNCETFLEYVRRDFCYFHNPTKDFKRPHVRIGFLRKTPPWEEIPAGAQPLFKTDGSVVYKQGQNRYVDHDREVLAIYDLKRDQGTVYCDDPDAMYRIAYSLLMTRIGLRLDASGLHRMHTLGITIDDAALLFLAEGGCGKTTLGLEMMKHPQVGWLTDDILAVDSSGRALAFPTSPRLIEGSVVPWLPPSVNLLKGPMPKDPPKFQLPAWSLLPRVCPSAKLGALFLCRRRPGVGPIINRVGVLEAFRGICDNALLGKDFGHVKAYHLQFSPVYLFKMACVYLSRIRAFIHLAWTVPVFRFEMGGQISENASLLLSMWAEMRSDRVCRSVDNSNAVPAVGNQKLGEHSTTQE